MTWNGVLNSYSNQLERSDQDGANMRAVAFCLVAGTAGLLLHASAAVPARVGDLAVLDQKLVESKAHDSFWGIKKQLSILEAAHHARQDSAFATVPWYAVGAVTRKRWVPYQAAHEWARVQYAGIFKKLVPGAVDVLK